MFEDTDCEKYSEEIEADLNKYWTRIDKSQYDPLWHESYWDGPINGVLDMNGQKCFFFQISEAKTKDCPNYKECNDRYKGVKTAEEIGEVYVEDLCPPDDEWEDCHIDGFRYYAVVKLSDVEWGRKKSQHKRFERFVGNHSSYPAWNNNAEKYTQPQRMWNRFYDWAKNLRHKPKIMTLKDNYDDIIGWIREIEI